MRKIILTLLTILMSFPFLLPGQVNDTLPMEPEPIRRNVIKFNPTPMMLWNIKNVTFSYERILNTKQSGRISA